MIDTFDKHIDFCCFYQYKTVIRIFRITENRLFESDFDRIRSHPMVEWKISR
mgnify:CR=1 FL=1